MATKVAPHQQINNRTDWAEDEDDDPLSLPPTTVTRNKDGSETTISYSLNENGKQVKSVTRVRKTVVKQIVNPKVVERKQWAKFGLDTGKPAGPLSDTTKKGENIVFRPVAGWKPGLADGNAQADIKKIAGKESIHCRICKADHWTSKCPFRNTMEPETEPGPGLRPTTNEEEAAGANGSGNYIAPHLRKGGAASAERMNGKFERDDMATLRVTNVTEYAEELDLREMFSKYGRVTRVYLAKDRETGRTKGFAFVSFDNRADAIKARDKMDGYGYGHLILRVELANKTT